MVVVRLVAVVIICFSNLINLRANVFSETNKNRTPFHKKHLTWLQELSANYNEAKSSYHKSGPQSFLKHWEISYSEKQSLQSSMFKGLPILPDLKITGANSFELDHKNGTSFKFEISDLENQSVNINSISYHFKSDVDLIEHVKNIESLLIKQQNLSLKHISFFDKIIVSAHASVAVALIAGGIAAILFKSFFQKNKKELESNRANNTDYIDENILISRNKYHADQIPQEPKPALTPITLPDDVTSDFNKTINQIISSDRKIPQANVKVLRSVQNIGENCTFETNTQKDNVIASFINYPSRIAFDQIAATDHKSYSYIVFAAAAREADPEVYRDHQDALLNLKPKTTPTEPGEKKPDIYDDFVKAENGTLAIFDRYKLGSKFHHPSEAIPGDFINFKWSPESSNLDLTKLSESHSGVYIGQTETTICFAGSNPTQNLNQRTGCGISCVPKNAISTTHFTRLVSPENIKNLAKGIVN